MSPRFTSDCPGYVRYIVPRMLVRGESRSALSLLTSPATGNCSTLSSKEDSLRQRKLVRLYPGDQQFPKEWGHASPKVNFVDCWGAPSLSNRRVAIVGSRRCTSVGERMAHRMGRELTTRGWAVVSGLARGIDGAALEGALKATWEDSSAPAPMAILGNGLPAIYPPEHEDLAFRIIQAGGALYSEFDRQAPPRRQHFPKRNRLISAISRGVVVIEATLRSGSLITANWALEQGREVFAVPGSPEGPGSAGCHRLIREGAALVTCAEEVLEGLLQDSIATPAVPERLRTAFLTGERDLSRLQELTQIPPVRLLQHWEALLSESLETDECEGSDENSSVS